MKQQITYEYFDVYESYRGGFIEPLGTHTADEILKEINYCMNKTMINLKDAEDHGYYERKLGWFGRMIEPGFMDTTDWSGPFDSENECKEYLEDLYGTD